MSLVLNLPPELEEELAAEATQLGLSLQDYIMRLLTGCVGLRPQLQSGAELVSYWQGHGLVGTRSDVVDSAAHARALREQSQHPRDSK